MNDVPGDLIRAAEQLFAERGVEAVSLRDINAAAGATNASAIQYHYGNRGGLLRAILVKHRGAVEAHRHRLLDAYDRGDDARTTPAMRLLAAALVEPFAAELHNRDGGAGYLQLLADIYNRPHPVVDPAIVEDPADSLYRWRATVEPLLEPAATRLHRRFDTTRFAVTELARRARTPSRRRDRLFTSQLVDLVTALLEAPVSEETGRLLGLESPRRDDVSRFGVANRR